MCSTRFKLALCGAMISCETKAAAPAWSVTSTDGPAPRANGMKDVRVFGFGHVGLAVAALAAAMLAGTPAAAETSVAARWAGT